MLKLKLISFPISSFSICPNIHHKPLSIFIKEYKGTSTASLFPCLCSSISLENTVEALNSFVVCVFPTQGFLPMSLPQQAMSSPLHLSYINSRTCCALFFIITNHTLCFINPLSYKYKGYIKLCSIHGRKRGQPKFQNRNSDLK